MSRKYTKINQYEKEILQWKSEGMTKREIAQRPGLEYAQIHNWISRYNERQRKLKAGIPLRKKGRPGKDAEPRDFVAEQAYTIQRLRIENELLRDFMQFMGRR